MDALLPLSKSVDHFDLPGAAESSSNSGSIVSDREDNDAFGSGSTESSNISKIDTAESNDDVDSGIPQEVIIVRIVQDNSFALAKMGDVKTLRERLAIRPKELNKKSSMGMTPLHGAAWVGHVECIRLLLSLGADANIEDIDGDTPLSWACSHGNLSCVNELIASGAKWTSRNKAGNTCVHWAAMRGHNSVLTCLIDKFGDKILAFKNKVKIKKPDYKYPISLLKVNVIVHPCTHLQTQTSHPLSIQSLSLSLFVYLHKHL